LRWLPDYWEGDWFEVVPEVEPAEFEPADPEAPVVPVFDVSCDSFVERLRLIVVFDWRFIAPEFESVFAVSLVVVVPVVVDCVDCVVDGSAAKAESARTDESRMIFFIFISFQK
jgi:hypothetical protein